MNPERFRELQEVFFKAADLEDPELSEFLSRLGREDPKMEEQLQGLLYASSHADSLFEEPVLPFNLNPLRHLNDFIPEEPLPKTPEKIGPYHIVRVLGHGGMGVVYQAQCHQPLFREVALKVVKSNVQDSEFLDRLKWEGQALALMNHDHIARIFEVNVSETGLPYFTMEYIDGQPINRFCDKEEMSFRDRTRLFLQICDAVQHAHTRGVIHGDLKPSNVLIAQGHRGPTAKVIDFGVSRAYKSFTAGLAHTSDQLLFGSPSYMSPEQARQDGNVDARSDIYALGAILYELATGAKIIPSHEVNGLLPGEKLRRIQENQPCRPAVLLRDMDEETAKKRGIKRGRPDSETRHDLDHVIMKALKSDPNQRYATVKELKDDLNRYLNHQPLDASGNAFFHLRKWARRHRIQAFILAVLAFMILLGMTGSSVVLYKTRKAKAEVEAALEKMTRTQDFYDQIIRMPHPYQNKYDINFTEVLGNWEAKLEQEAAGDPELQARVRLTLGETWMGLGLFSQAREQFEMAYQLRVALFGPEDSQTLEAKSLMARSLLGMNELEKAEALFKETLATQERVLGAAHPARMWTQEGLATVYMNQDRYDEAATLCTEARNVLMKESDIQRIQDTTELLANIRTASGDKSGAVALLRQLLADQQRTRGETHARTLITAQNLANALLELSEFEEAESLFRFVYEQRLALLGKDHPHTLSSMSGLAIALRRRGFYEEAKVMAEAAWQGQKEVLPPNHPKTLATRKTLASLAATLDGPEAAIKILEELLDIYREKDELGNSEALLVQNNLGHYLTEVGRGEEALEVLNQALSIKTKLLGREHPSTLNTMVTLGETLQTMGRLNTASQSYQEAISLMKAHHPGDVRNLAVFQAYYGSCLTEMKRYNEAEALLKECLEKVEPSSGSHNLVRRFLGNLYEQWGDSATAERYRNH